jgi:hypothetical protein
MSSDLFFVDVVGENRLLNFDRQPETVRALLLQKVEDWTERLYEATQDNIYARTKGDTLSGRMIASLRSQVFEEGKRIRGRVYYDLGVAPHARIQELGGTTPPHMIFPTNGKVLAFIGATGDKVITSRVFHPGGVIPPMYAMKDAYREMGPEISRGIKRAIVQGIMQDMRRNR